MLFDSKLDFPFQEPLPVPNFAEAQMWNFTDGKYGFIFHPGSMPGDLKLWHNAVAVTCPDGSVLATKVIGRGPLEGFGSDTANSRTIEPYRKWELNFDGALRRYHPESLQLGPGTDGRHLPVKVHLDVSAPHSVWDPGAALKNPTDGIFDTMCLMHHEQALTATGFIEIEGKRIAFDGIGHRDHSYGPREMGKLLRGFWINGTFDSGWAFLAFEGTAEGSHLVRRGAIFEDGAVIECEITHDAILRSAAPDPRQFTLSAHLPNGSIREIVVACTNGVNWTANGPAEWCVGTDLSNPRNYIFSHYFAELRCGDEKGLGFADRGAQAALLQNFVEAAPASRGEKND